jgi:succinyl-CoA synthetase beta subunit
MARILENYALELLKKAGAPVVRFKAVATAIDAETCATEWGCPVVVKALVPVGGRGKAGAVRFADTPADATRAADLLIGSTVKGYPVRQVLVVEKIQAATEIYLSISLDARSARPVVVASAAGGVDIEETATRTPEQIVTRPLDPLSPPAAHQFLDLLLQAGLTGKTLVKAAGVLKTLCHVFMRYDATLLEVNPLFMTAEGAAIIPACMLSVDDSALFRQPDLAAVAREGSERSWKPQTEIERRVQAVNERDPYRGTARYTELEGGDIGFMCGGGGGSLVLFDELLAANGKPGNYTEFGGNPPEDKVYGLASCILSKPGVRGLFVAHNITNNTQVDVEARGIVRAISEAGIDPKTFPIVTRMPGVSEDEGFRILRGAGVECYGEELTLAGSARRMAAKMKETYGRRG